MKKNKSIRGCEIVSNLQDKDGNPLWDMELMESVLKEKQHCIKEFAYIIHDKDTYSAEEAEKNPDHKENSLKPAHIHLLLRFATNQPQHLNSVAGWFNIAPNFLENIKDKWESAVKYLTHANAPGKYQYDTDEVTANFDVEEILNESDKKGYLEKVLQRILDGDIREYNKTLEIDNMALVRYAQTIEQAFKVRSEYLQATQKERNTDVIFITGSSGSGKTTLAKKIAREQGLAYFVSSGSNDIMDGYGQEPCLIIDDARPSSMGLSDFLKLLDNNTASSVKSRYKNKYLNCELIIVTTVLDIDTFYSKVFESEEEPIIQLKRRCQTLIKVTHHVIEISRWDSAFMNYTRPVCYENNLLQEYISEPKTRESVKQEIAEMFPFLQPLDMTTSGFTLTKIEKVPESKTISDKNYDALMGKE